MNPFDPDPAPDAGPTSGGNERHRQADELTGFVRFDELQQAEADWVQAWRALKSCQRRRMAVILLFGMGGGGLVVLMLTLKVWWIGLFTLIPVTAAAVLGYRWGWSDSDDLEVELVRRCAMAEERYHLLERNPYRSGEDAA